jgi:diguanylate cyclase (GGDEF)-like protein
MYALLAVCVLVSFIGGSGRSIGAVVGIIAASLVLIFLEVQAGRGKMLFLEYGKSSVIYHMLRVVLACAAFYLVQTEYERAITIVMMVLFSIEAVLYVPFDETINRVVTYLIMVVLFLATFGVNLLRLSQEYSEQHPKQDLPVATSFQVLVLGVLLVLAVIMVGEVLAAMWNCFEKKIFAQDRAVENLNELNTSLQEHQEQIKKINEVLGRQKIDLQSANKKINRAHDEMSVQSEIASTISSSIGKEEMLENVTKIMQVRLDMDVVMVILEPDNALLAPGEEPKGRYVAISGSMGKEYEEAVLKSVRETELKELMSLSQTYMQNLQMDTIKFFKYLDDEKELPSMIYIPIVKQSERLGTLIIGKNKMNAFMDGRNFYENVASQLCIGISNARLYAKMNDMAIRDGLTRIYNRGHLQELLNEYLTDAMNKKIPVTLALFDIDKFKLVNDNYGHQCGDAVICHVAHLLNKGALSHGGIAGRYGGEEFVIAFLDKNVEETYEIVKNIHDEIRAKVVNYDNREIHVTASAGIASYPETCTNPSEILTRADWAMYTSKKNGRDKITIDSDQIEAMM